MLTAADLQRRQERRRELYPGGRRRPGPNSYDYDPHARNLLDHACPVTFKRPPPRAIRCARWHWQDPTVWRARKRVHHELRQRRRQVTVELVPGAKAVRRTHVHEVSKGATPRGDRRSLQQRALACIAEHADVVSNVVGRWGDDGKFKGFLSRHQWAKRVGCTVRQWDRLVSDYKAAGFIKRRQRRDLDLDTGEWKGRIASLVVTDKFWQCSGAWGLRRAYLQALEDKRRQDARAARAARPPSPLEVVPETSAEVVTAVLTGRAPSPEEAAQLRAEHGIRGWRPPSS